jgi:hypothetical protein
MNGGLPITIDAESQIRQTRKPTRTPGDNSSIELEGAVG